MKLEELIDKDNPTIFVDMDGVLADFVAGVKKLIPDYDDAEYEKSSAYRSKMWRAVSEYSKQGGELWYGLPLMDDAKKLWTYVSKYKPEILSATGRKDYQAARQKKNWIAKHFGNGVKVNLTQKAVEKAQHAKKGYILIDDKMKAIQPWRDAGGIGILHTSAASTIKQLKKLGL